MAKLVLDISKYDKNIDLQAWKDRYDVWGVIIKAGGNEGGRYKEIMFDRNYEEAKRVGLHIGYYYYTTVTSVDEARLDARHFIDIISGHNWDLPCYMDVEDRHQYNLSTRDLTDVIKAFCDTLIENGYYAGLYVNGSTWTGEVYKEELSNYANWIAWWGSAWPGTKKVGDIGMWQQGGMRFSDGDVVYDDKAGYVDISWCDIDYPSRIKNGWKSQSEVVVKPDDKKIVLNGSAADLVKAAYSQLGYCASDDPLPGSKFGRWMAELTGEDWLAGPSREIWWCCIFTSWALNVANVIMDGFPNQNTDEALRHGALKYAIDIHDVQYGDIVIFNWNWDDKTDHIGIATGSFDGYGFTTIEGNVSNSVLEKYRQLGNVAYVLRPPFGADTSSKYTKYVPSVSTNPKNNRDGGKLDVDGIGGWNTIIDWQNQLGTTEDGWITGQRLPEADYRWAICNVKNGTDGSLLVKAIQNKVGVNQTGFWGKDTSLAIQRWLVDHGYSVGDSGIDGFFGTDSVKALQNSLNDGAWK